MKNRMMEWAALFALATTLSACGDAGGEGGSEPVGSVEMNLAAPGASGVTYRLRNAQFRVERPGVIAGVLDTESDPDATVLTASFPPNDYTVTLLNGWSFDRADTGETVEASLLSPAAVPVTILANQTRTVSYKFRVANEDIVLAGDLAIVVNVCGEDSFEPNDVEADATELPFDITLNAGICPSDDFFVFDQGAFPGTTDFVQIDFSHAAGDLDLQVTLPDGTVLESASIDDRERVEFPADQAGPHLVRVFGFRGATGNYSIIHGEVPASP